MRAGVRPLSGVNAQVRLQVSRLGELLAALAAAERPLARVDPHVNVQVLRRGVRPVADGANEALPSGAGARLSSARWVPVEGKVHHVGVLVLKRRVAAFRQLAVCGSGARDADQFDPESIAVHVFVLLKLSESHLTFGLFGPRQAEI